MLLRDEDIACTSLVAEQSSQSDIGDRWCPNLTEQPGAAHHRSLDKISEVQAEECLLWGSQYPEMLSWGRPWRGGFSPMFCARAERKLHCLSLSPSVACVVLLLPDHLPPTVLALALLFTQGIPFIFSRMETFI